MTHIQFTSRGKAPAPFPLFDLPELDADHRSRSAEGFEAKALLLSAVALPHGNAALIATARFQ